jgi:hypothetical protein
LFSVTDMSYIGGRVVFAGLSHEEFASNLRAVAFPFSEVDPGTSVEVFHGAHGQLESAGQRNVGAQWRRQRDHLP